MLHATPHLTSRPVGLSRKRSVTDAEDESADFAALEQLFRTHWSTIYGTAYRIVRHAEDARGVVQETFFRAIKSYSAFRGDARLSTWVCGIAINVARNHVHRRIRYRALGRVGLDEADVAEIAFDRADPLAELEKSEQQALVLNAIGRLPTIYRDVVRLRDLDELTTREVSMRLGLSEGNVRIRLCRGHRLLRTMLQQREPSSQA